MMKLMNILQFLLKKPSDRTIILMRIIFGLVYSGLMFYNLIYLDKGISSSYIFGLINLDETGVLILKYIFSSLGLIPLFMGITNMCVLKKKHYKIIQIIFGFLMFYIAGSIDDTPDLDFDILIGLMGLVPLFMGITGKGITSKCMRYKEKVTKIRV